MSVGVDVERVRLARQRVWPMPGVRPMREHLDVQLRHVLLAAPVSGSLPVAAAVATPSAVAAVVASSVAGAGGGAGGSPFGGGFTDGGGAGGGGGGSCLPESDGVLCARLHLDCGAVNIMDTCGLARSLSCGMCSSPRVCGGDGLANVCSTPCRPESDATFCARLGASCGSATQFDNCGVTRTVASCGACMNDCQTQSTCVNNACIGTPKADGERCGAPAGRDFCRTGQCTTAQAYCEPSGTQFIYSSATKTTSGAGPCVCSTTTALHFEYGASSSLPAEDTTCTACSTSTQRAVCF